MAQTRKTTTNTKKSGTGSRSSSVKKTAENRARREPPPPAKKPIRREVTGGILAFVGLFSLIGYFNVNAFAIDWLREIISGLIGWGFYIFPPVMLLGAAIMIFHHGRPVALRFTAAMILPVLFGAMAHLLFSRVDLTGAGGFMAMVTLLYSDGTAMAFGGVITGFIAYGLELALSVYGAFPLLLVIFLFLLWISTGSYIMRVVNWLKAREKAEYEPEPLPDPEPAALPVNGKKANSVEPKIETIANHRKSIDIPLDEEPVEEPPKKKGLFVRPKKTTEAAKEANNPADATKDITPLSVEEAAGIAGVSVSLAGSETISASELEPPKKAAKVNVEAETTAVAEEIEKHEADNAKLSYSLPPVSLLRKSPATAVDGREEIAVNKKRLATTLKSFGVNANISFVTRGSTVTRYDFELEQGVKLSKVTNLAGDIALALGVVSVRIAPIPDKISTVGIEVPNKLVSPVYLRDIIDGPKFANSPNKLSFAIGKDISGEGIVGNIAKLPHLLIAGTTGSGKSVCMNSLILSLLYKAKPDEVKLIMIDPKMVELGIYNGIPHLYIPVVTDPKKAAGALQWSVVEMLKRYRLFSEIGVRDLATYNEHMKKDNGQTLPQVVIVIDELADLMMAASKEVEESVCRVAQMGRAAGMHLVIATQRPSADVITGLMKANIPSRIAFAVSSAMESRIILDQAGAEKLIGMGDMLFAPIGTGKPQRIQGAFVSDEEREEVISFIKKQGTAEYSDEIIASIEKAAEEKNSKSAEPEPERGEGGGGDYDELIPQAVDVIFDTKQASVSMLQRRLKLGYSRAARLVDQMEEMGIVGPFEGSKPRQVLITREQWQEMQMIHGTAPTEIMETRMEFGDDSQSEYSDGD